VARKPKRRQSTRARRPANQTGQATPAAAQGTATPATPATASRSQPRVGGDQALVRSVEMSLAPQATASRSRGGRLVLDSADPAIPLDRVPYFVSDLKRLAIVASGMVVLLVVGALLVIPIATR
jgi:hypothetical protein